MLHQKIKELGVVDPLLKHPQQVKFSRTKFKIINVTTGIVLLPDVYIL